MKIKNADTVCFLLTSLVCLQQGNVKKSEKSYDRLKEFEWNFQENMSYDNIKNHQKIGF